MAKLSYDDYKKAMNYKDAIQKLEKAADSFNNANGDPTKAIDVMGDGVDAVIAFLPPGPQRDLIKATNDALRAIGNRGVSNVLDGLKRNNDALKEALGEAGVPGFSTKDGTSGGDGSSGTPPAGSEWQPTIVVSDNGRDFTQGPSQLVPAGTKSPNNVYFDPNGNRIYPPEGGWANPDNPNEKIPEPVPYEPTKPKLEPSEVKTPNDAAKNHVPLRDPLTLDLDNDGLETTGIAATNPILFDHDGDGVKNGTGWVSSDDAFLVLDKNGNGTIDNGRELFGDSTIKSNGQTAADGFDALADLDSNADGKISSLDAQFNNLRLWRDLNQDGISQSGELFTLTSQNIVSINITKTANSQTLTNGNQIADLGTFTRTDGTTGSAGAVTGNLADINLASDTFHHPSLRAQSAWQSKQSHDKAGLLHKVRNDSSVSENDTKWRIAA